MYVIAADGSADFLSMADAAKSLPDGALVVYREGEHEENAVFPQNDLRIVGEHTGRTKVRGRVLFTGTNAVVENITFLDSVEGALLMNCVVDGKEMNTAPPPMPCVYLLGDSDVSPKRTDGARDCRLAGCSVKRFITEKHFNYAELCFHRGDNAYFCLSRADRTPDVCDFADPERIYPQYLAMIQNAARESGVALAFVMDSSRSDAHAAAARAFCQSRNISFEEAAL